MEALQHAVHSFSPISCTGSRNPSSSLIAASAVRSFPPTISSSSASAPSPLQARAFTKLEASLGASASNGRSTRALVFVRHNAAAGYAAALAEIGRSYRILDRIHADLKKLACILQHKPLFRLLLNPSVRDTHKLKIFARLAEEAAFQPHTLKIVNLMIEKKRTALLKDLVKEFEVIYSTIASTKNSLMLAATELDRAQLASVTKQISNMPMALASKPGNPAFA